MADKGGLQLLPETRKKIEIKIPGQNRTIYTGIALIVLVLVIYFGLLVYIGNLQSQITNVDEQIAALETGRNKQTEQSLITLSKQVATTANIIQSHIYWSTGLSKIEAGLQHNVQFKSFSSNFSDGSFNIRAATDNYSTIARQLSSFVADNSIKDVSLGGVNTLTSGKLDFNVKLLFDKSKFLKSSQ